MTESLEQARGLLASGDVSGLLRYLRTDQDELSLREVAGLLAGAARLAALGDLEQAAALVAGGAYESAGDELAALWAFGYSCVGHRAEFLAIRPLARALELAPDAGPVLGELVTALEGDGQHARAVAVLEDHEPVLEWLHRYQYVYNAVMAGELGKAAAGFGRLPEPEDEQWGPARERVRRMLARANALGEVSPLDFRDLRGWHYVLTGGVLGCVSPYGFGEAMTGRYAYLNDSARGCAAGLRRLRLVLEAAGAAVESVALLPDRSSRIIGLAAAEVLGLPAADFDLREPGAGALVVAYDLAFCDSEFVASLRERVPGQVLFERATCWTDPPRVTADVCGLLAQFCTPPWEGQLGRLEDGTVGELPGDDRPVEEIAAEIVCAEPDEDVGDGSAPPDPDEGLRRFVEAVMGARAREVGGGWLGGGRYYVPNAGPVPSSRFL